MSDDPIVEKFKRIKAMRQGTPEERAELERRAKIAAKAVLAAEQKREEGT